MFQPNFEDRTQSPSEAERTAHNMESMEQLKQNFAMNNPYSSMKSSINSKMSLSTTNGKIREFTGQETENLRQSYIQLGESQVDVNSQLLSPKNYQDG